MSEPTHEIIEDGRAIKCLLCQSISYHPDDVSCLYCSKCGVFHEDLMVEEKTKCQEDITKQAIASVAKGLGRTEQSRGKKNWRPICVSTRRSQRGYSGHGSRTGNSARTSMHRRLF
jgi:hypothetical protein